MQNHLPGEWIVEQDLDSEPSLSHFLEIPSLEWREVRLVPHPTNWKCWGLCILRTNWWTFPSVCLQLSAFSCLPLVPLPLSPLPPVCLAFCSGFLSHCQLTSTSLEWPPPCHLVPKTLCGPHHTWALFNLFTTHLPTCFPLASLLDFLPPLWQSCPSGLGQPITWMLQIPRFCFQAMFPLWSLCSPCGLISSWSFKALTRTHPETPISPVSVSHSLSVCIRCRLWWKRFTFLKVLSLVLSLVYLWLQEIFFVYSKLPRKPLSLAVCFGLVINCPEPVIFSFQCLQWWSVMAADTTIF